jgi:hypothetical protein
MWNKNIFQTYECDFEELHESFKKCCDCWKSTYPDWKYYFKNSKGRREDVVDILCLSSLEAEIYDNHSGTTQSDIWRYAVTSVYGGMYADLDSVPVSNIEPILNELDGDIELVAMPDGYQRMNGRAGSNNSNFIFKAESKIALSLLFSLKYYFDTSAKRLNDNLAIEQLNSNQLFAAATILHKSKVAQIFDTKYVIHGKDFKPDDEYRHKCEKQINHSYFER